MEEYGEDGGGMGDFVDDFENLCGTSYTGMSPLEVQNRLGRNQEILQQVSANLRSQEKSTKQFYDNVQMLAEFYKSTTELMEWCNRSEDVGGMPPLPVKLAAVNMLTPQTFK
mmetsp:Transcript_18898/g.53076  ORF Transcript_18898/g.53076 Transcript_18898/m.53076 type:complete len:112 (-) Transcript_18898:302-637(-)|eukprot:CAMPEP_0119128106 /NCGR_PEP_ID=MMETSP1310-20130426/6391_1 /TAXON_ID=464262 /ORGANISM="Genus nov. species nov., Strain RCC2339" /LENGTH=111 /DNA_ID=CAMNT_0007118413 /DNA_START=103 /DNA_END=438 /DNA_ORIENTATION=+